MKRLLQGIVLVAAVGAALPGCGGGGGGGVSIPVVPIRIPPIAVNVPDTFSLVGVSIAYSDAHEYWWSCSAAQAEIALAEGIAEGSIRLEVYDGAGVLVHDNTFEGTMEGAVYGVTAPYGVPGTWRVRFSFDDAIYAGAIVLTADTAENPDEVGVGGMYDTSCTMTYAVGWDGNPAEVSVATGLFAGSVRVRVWDATGADVFDQTVYVAYYGLTLPGAPGVWSVRIDIDGAAMGGAIVVRQP